MYTNISDNTVYWNQNYILVLQSLRVTCMDQNVYLLVNYIPYCTSVFLRLQKLELGAFIMEQ